MPSSYLLTWNPTKFDWPDDELSDFVRRARLAKPLKFHWSCGKTLKPKRGDRVFLMKLGSSGRGVFASGNLIRDSYHRADEDFGNAVDVAWDVFLDPRDAANLFNPAKRREPALKKQMWTPQMSGTAIRTQAADRLETLWKAHQDECGAAIPRSPVSGEERQREANLAVHSFRLREDLELRFSLPSDMTTREAERIGTFFKTLVVEDQPKPEAKPRQGLDPLVPWDLNRHSMVGLGPSTEPPSGTRLRLPSGVSIRDKLRGRASEGEKVGSGNGHVDVGLRLSGGTEARDIIFPAGLVMISKSTHVQNGLLVQPVQLRVPAKAEMHWVLAMYCANQARKEAEEDSEFTLGPIVDDPSLHELFALLDGKKIPSDKTQTVQNAVWEITDGDGLRPESRAELTSL